jgi:hypothetical protein
LVLLADEVVGADFRTLLDTFNDRWVGAARFLSPQLLIELLRLSGEWTAAYYESVDAEAPCEPVGLFGASPDTSSPFWQAIAREYLERWIHHSQIRRALGLPSLAEPQFLVPGVEICAAIARMAADIPSDPDGPWSIGPIGLGSTQQVADILTRAHSAEGVRDLVDGPVDLVGLFAAVTGRP